MRRFLQNLLVALFLSVLLIATSFLVDSTGNRRFVPLEVGGGFQIPWKKLVEERDSLWAAAVQAYRDGVGYEFNSGEIAAIAEYIQEFGDPDPWMDKIATYVQSVKKLQLLRF